MRTDTRDLVGGGILTLVGGYVLLRSMDYSIGTARQMGPGYYPMVVSIILIVLGLSIMALSFRRSGRIPMPEWRPLAAVLGSVLIFALCVRHIGLMPAVIGCTFACAAGHKGWDPKATAVVAVFMAVVCWLLFSKFLGVTMPALTWPVVIL